jgi:hypothetical protein
MYLNDGLINPRKRGVVSGLLLSAVMVLAIGLVAANLPGTSAHAQTQLKLRQHAKAIANRYIVVLRDDTVNNLGSNTAVADIARPPYCPSRNSIITAEESAYCGAPGYYTWRVYAYSGNGSYEFWLQRT